MSFYDKLGTSLTNAGRLVSQKAKNFSDTTALQREMNAEKRNIQQKYAEIGQRYYEKFCNDPGADFFDEMESITESARRIEEIEGEIQEVQERKPELMQVPVSAKGVQPSAMVCMQCGASYADITQVFCSSCGQKLTAQYPSAAAAYLAPSQTASDVQNRPEAIKKQPALTKPADIVHPDTSKKDQPVADAPAKEAAPSKDAAARPRFCTKCGARADDDSLFCAQCGNKLG